MNELAFVYLALADSKNTARVSAEQDAFWKDAERIRPASPFDF